MPDASLWACLIRDVTTQETAAEGPRALVSTRRFADGFAALQAFCPRWHIEDDAYRLQAGERLAVMPIRRLRRQRQRELGERSSSALCRWLRRASSTWKSCSPCWGLPPRESLLPTLVQPSFPDFPT